MPDEIPTTDADGLNNVSETGKTPGRRIADYKSAATIVRNLIQEDADDRIDRINEQALLDGQGPFIQEELVKAGQGWRQNNNWGGAQAKFEQALAPYHDLENGVTIDLPPDITGPVRGEWQAIMAAAWQYLHTEVWTGFNFQNHNLYRNFVGFGVGVAEHEHPRDFRWRAGGLGEHYFSRPVQADVEAVTIHARVREYRPDELMRWYENPLSPAAGFNKDQLKKALLACNSGASGDDYWNSLSNDVYGQSYSRRAVVRIFNLRVGEFVPGKDGAAGKEKISSQMGLVDAGDADDYIYRSKPMQMADKMSDCLTLFLAGIGNGNLHSIKGLARKVFATSQTENQFINQMFDFARIYMSPMFESDSANGAQLLANMQIGLFNLIPRGLKLVSTSATAPDYAKSILPLLGFSSQLGQQAAGVFQQTPVPAGVEQTREEIVQRTRDNAVLGSAAITLFTAARERLANSMGRRLVNPDYTAGDPGFEMKEKFIKYCTDRGVPRTVVMRMGYIKVNRSVGGGSSALGQMLLKEAQGLRQFLDPVGQKTLDEMVFTRLLGPDTAHALMPNGVGIVRSTDQQRFAMEENCWFEKGTTRPTLPDDDHFLHALTHNAAFPDMDQKFASGAFGQPDQTGSNPVAEGIMVAFLNAIIPHQQAHLAAIPPNRAQQDQIGDFHLNLNKAIQNQQHLVAKAQAEQDRLAQQAQTQEAQGNGGTAGTEAPDPHMAALQAKFQLELSSKQALAQQELQHNQALHDQSQTLAAAAHAQKLQQQNELNAARAAGRDAQKASDILGDQLPKAE